MPDPGYKECPDCEGVGYEEVQRGGVNGLGPWVEYSTRQGLSCDGLGEVPLDD